MEYDEQEYKEYEEGYDDEKDECESEFKEENIIYVDFSNKTEP